MDGFLDFEECLQDSPAFRLAVDQFESDVAVLELQINKVLTCCSTMVEAGQVYSSANQQFVSSLAEFSGLQEKDSTMGKCLSQLDQGLQEVLTFHTILLDQTQRAINQQLTSLLTQFFPPLGEIQRECVRVRDHLDMAALKNAQVSRHKASDAEQASHLLIATRKCYQHFALDYCLQLNNFKVQQKVDILNSVFSSFHAQYTFFHQGFDLLKDLQPTMKTMATQLAQLSAECTVKRKHLEHQHLVVQQRDVSGEPVVGPDDVIQSFLFKRSRRKTKTWKRGWFSLKNNQLIYRKSHKESPLVLFEDLRLCAAKCYEETERRFCFQLLSVHKSCVLQADSEQGRCLWIAALLGNIDLKLQQTQPQEPAQYYSSKCPPGASVLTTALGGAGNHRCCDCGATEPRWASINLGVTMCIECSGIHRSLGVHVSKVRSLTLDSWEPEQLKLLSVLGNDVMNRMYEATCGEQSRAKPRPHSPRADKETWIKEKYVEKRFVERSSADVEGGKEGAGHDLYQGAFLGDVVAMAAALSQGAEVNGRRPDEENRTAIMAAAAGGSLLACDFLLLNGSNVNHRDDTGRGALHTAVTRGHTGQVCLLLKRGANQYAADERGQDPLAIAVEITHADIVTLLRMARMNEEMRDSEGVSGTLGDDETFQEIFRDFSNMASNQPDRLSRRRLRQAEEDGEQSAGAST